MAYLGIITKKYGTLMPTVSVAKVSKTQRAQSFHYLGPRYFNCLPRYLSNSNVEFSTWKKLFNKFLRTIPDTPTTADLTSEVCERYSALPSNSLLSWIPYLHLDNRRGGKSINTPVHSVKLMHYASHIVDTVSSLYRPSLTES